MWSLYLFAGLTGVSAYGGIQLARAQWLSTRGRVRLTAVALGIILFVIYDVFADAQGVIARDALGQANTALMFEGILAGGAVGGLGALGWAERNATRAAPQAGLTHGIIAIAPAPRAELSGTGSVQLPIVVAAGIGVHGLFEGFSVGTAFATGVLSLALVLVVGMCLHKVGEGVCICGCSVGSDRHLTSVQLAGLGLLAGGPIALGILTGNFVASVTWISLLSFGVAIGVMAYVGIKLGRAVLADRLNLTLGIGGAALGFLAGLATSLLVGLGSG